MSANSWRVFCDPLNRADHWIRQSDIPKAIANFKALTGENPKYIMACPPSKYMDELAVPEDIELITQTGIASWELRLAAVLPYPEKRGANIFHEKIEVGQKEEITPEPVGLGKNVTAADTSTIPETPQDVKKASVKIIHDKRLPLPVTKIRHVNSRKRRGVPKVENHVLGRPRKIGGLSKRTLYRRKAELKRKQQPVMI